MLLSQSLDCNICLAMTFFLLLFRLTIMQIIANKYAHKVLKITYNAYYHKWMLQAKAFWWWDINKNLCRQLALFQSLTCWLAGLLTHRLTHSLTHLLTLLAHTLTEPLCCMPVHLLTYSLTHSCMHTHTCSHSPTHSPHAIDVPMSHLCFTVACQHLWRLLMPLLHSHTFIRCVWGGGLFALYS